LEWGLLGFGWAGVRAAVAGAGARHGLEWEPPGLGLGLGCSGGRRGCAVSGWAGVRLAEAELPWAGLGSNGAAARTAGAGVGLRQVWTEPVGLDWGAAGLGPGWSGGRCGWAGAGPGLGLEWEPPLLGLGWSGGTGAGLGLVWFGPWLIYARWPGRAPTQFMSMEIVEGERGWERERNIFFGNTHTLAPLSLRMTKAEVVLDFLSPCACAPCTPCLRPLYSNHLKEEWTGPRK
jgi:hypothetical protein